MSDKLRVLHLTLRSDFSGGPLYVERLMRGLEAETEGFVACPSNGELFLRYVKIVGADNICIVPERSFRITSLLDIYRYVRRKQIDVLHSHGKGAGLYSRLIGLIARIPVVHTYHGLHIGAYGFWSSCVYTVYERIMSLLTRRIVAVIASEKTAAIAAGLSAPNVVLVVETGLDRLPDATPASGRQDVVRVAHLTRFDTQKNFDLLVQVAERAIALGVDQQIHFQVVGDVARAPDLQNDLAHRGLASLFTFEGVVDDIATVYAKCRALMSTSRWEGLPVAPLEAGQIGLYLALTNIPGHVELAIDRRDSVLFDPSSQSQIDEAVLFLASLAAREDIATGNAEALKKRFNYVDMLRSHIALYELIAPRARHKAGP